MTKKTITVPAIQVNNPSDKDAILEKLATISTNKIDTINWADEYPSKPEVEFKIAHDGKHIFLQYFVQESEILAKTSEDNGAVWTDSCVEFFMSLGNKKYYNAEFTCIGVGLLGCRESKENATHASDSIMKNILRFPSLGKEPFDSREGDFTWSLLLVIPVETYWEDNLKTFSGLKASANFYKCGDNLKTPHFLSWNAIETEKPNFHVPQFFGELIFTPIA